ncbi:hypothetical protein OROHE_007231 [Orobanche hederae]
MSTIQRRTPKSYAFNHPTLPDKHNPYPEDDEHMITPTKETWKLHVRVERLWTTYSPYNPTEKRSMELILLDAKGDKIQASIPKYLISKFEKLIKEGVFYHFTNFEIEQNNEEFIATRHPYRLKFHKFTSPWPAKNLPIPKYGFKFIPFAEFGTDKCYAKLLVDVIDEVLNVGDIVELNKNGQCTKRVTIHLLDSIGDTIECTLWNNYADQMVNYWKSNDGPVCVILQYAMVKDFRRELLPNSLVVKYLQNSIFATRMLINEDVPELADFMNSIKENSDARHLSPNNHCHMDLMHYLMISQLYCNSRVFVNWTLLRRNVVV